MTIKRITLKKLSVTSKLGGEAPLPVRATARLPKNAPDGRFVFTFNKLRGEICSEIKVLIAKKHTVVSMLFLLLPME